MVKKFLDTKGFEIISLQKRSVAPVRKKSSRRHHFRASLASS